MPNTVEDSVSFYLRAEDVSYKYSPNWNFGEFEYLHTDQNKIFFELDSAELLNTFGSQLGVNGLALSFSPLLNTFFFILFFLCFITFAIIYNREGNSFTANYRSVFSLSRYPVTLYKEQVTAGEIWGEFYMILQSVLVFTIIVFAYILYSGITFNTLNGIIVAFSGVFASVAVFKLLKLLIYKIISSFFLNNDIKNWIRRYFRLFELQGIILFLPAVLLIYLPEYRDYLFLFVLVIFLITRFIIAVETLNIFVKNKVGTFYFFSYLCGIEIAPYFIYYKLVLSIIRIVGNYIV